MAGTSQDLLFVSERNYPTYCRIYQYEASTSVNCIITWHKHICIYTLWMMSVLGYCTTERWSYSVVLVFLFKSNSILLKLDTSHLFTIDSSSKVKPFVLYACAAFTEIPLNPSCGNMWDGAENVLYSWTLHAKQKETWFICAIHCSEVKCNFKRSLMAMILCKLDGVFIGYDFDFLFTFSFYLILCFINLLLTWSNLIWID